jgi:hypothetical protein
VINTTVMVSPVRLAVITNPRQDKAESGLALGRRLAHQERVERETDVGYPELQAGRLAGCTRFRRALGYRLAELTTPMRGSRRGQATGTFFHLIAEDQ